MTAGRPTPTQELREVALLVGGGVSAELMPLVLEVIEAAGARFAWRRVDVPPATADAPADALDAAMAAVCECGVGLKTKLLGPGPHLQRRADSPGPRNPNVELRQRLDLYAGVRPLRSRRGLMTRYPDLDLILVRENTEDIYKGIEHEIVPGVIESLKVVTRSACDRIARFAFRLAEEQGRRHVTFIHKGNIMKRSDGLFMTTVRAVAEQHPSIGYREMIVDAACMKMVQDPYTFDVLLMGNLYGDILSSLGSGLAGGISSAYGVNVGDHCRVFEAIHGDAAHLEGTGRANPLPLLAPAVALLRHCGQATVADRIDHAIGDLLEQQRALTPDLGGDGTARAMCDALIATLSRA